jgi:hypothetical protein
MCMEGANFSIKTTGIKELEMALDWAYTEGWNPGLNDAECYFSVDEKVFYLNICKTP